MFEDDSIDYAIEVHHSYLSITRHKGQPCEKPGLARLGDAPPLVASQLCVTGEHSDLKWNGRALSSGRGQQTRAKAGD